MHTQINIFLHGPYSSFMQVFRKVLTNDNSFWDVQALEALFCCPRWILEWSDDMAHVGETHVCPLKVDVEECRIGFDTSFAH